MANLLTTDDELQQVANAIRTLKGTSEQLSFPAGFTSALNITRRSSSDLTASGNAVTAPAGYYAANATKTVGTSKAAATYYTSASDQSIAAGQYLAGAQTIKGVTTSNIAAGNIKAGVTVKVGDSADDDRIAGVAGTFTSDANAAAGHILSGKTAYVNGSKITGTIASKSSSDLTVSGNTVTAPAGYYASNATKTVGTAKAAATYYTSGSDQTIAAGQYLSGAQTIKAVTTNGLWSGNIKSGVTVKVGDADDTDRIINVTGTYKVFLKTAGFSYYNSSSISVAANTQEHLETTPVNTDKPLLTDGFTCGIISCSCLKAGLLVSVISASVSSHVFRVDLYIKNTTPNSITLNAGDLSVLYNGYYMEES